MKRRVIAACILIIFSLAISITGLAQLKRNCDELSGALYDLRLAALSAEKIPDNAAEVTACAVHTSAIWENKKTLFHVLTNHTELSEFETGIGQLEFFSENGDYTELVRLSEACLEEINHIKRSAELSISNIF